MESDKQKQEALKQMYRSGIKASYFAGMNVNDPKYVQKSQLQISKIKDTEEEKIDETTFRLQPNFKRPDENFVVYKKSGKCFIDKESLFSCFGKRKCYDIILKNSKLAIQSLDGGLARYVDFNVLSTEITDKGKSFVINFLDSDKEIYIEPVESEKDKNENKWVELLNKIANETEGRRKKFSYIARHSPLDFYKIEHILNQEFQKSANSGDILLFKSQHSAATIQRVFTDSEYDHVGVVLRNKKNELFVYESTSGDGVGLTPWKHMVNYQWYAQTDKICWRQLNMGFGPNEIRTMEAFVAKTLGKGFDINLEKLFQFQSTLKRTEEEEQNKTYFCSELIARLYKELGILDQSKSSTSYYPVDFSQKGNLKIIKPGVTLSSQKLISFDH